jgi:CyaY protein
MTDSEYLRLADAVFRQLEQGLEAAELDYELAPGGILEIDFDDGSKIVVNRQPAMHEVWVASRSGGFHYRWRDGVWRDGRGGGELYADLSAMASSQAGRAVVLAAEAA